MKKKWYRSNFCKVLLIIAFHAALAMAAVGVLFLAAMASQGIRIWDDRGKSYIDSESLAESVFDAAYEILDGIGAQEPLASSMGPDFTPKLVDLREVWEEQELTYTESSGLAYPLEELKQWAKKGWDIGSGSGDVIAAYTDAGEEYYYYRDDFLEMIETGKITFQRSDNVEETEKELLVLVKNRIRNGSFGFSEDFWGSVTDEERHVEYVDVYTYTDTTIVEKYPPAYADNLLDAVNNSSFWQGRLAEASEALNAALNKVRAENQKQQSLEEYQEGNTNLTYLYVDLDNQKIYTNKSEYEQYGAYKTALKEMADSGAYAIIKPRLMDCESNLNFDSSSSLQLWQHTVAQKSSSEDYIFAIAADENFPIADSLAETNALYNKFISERFLIAQLLGAALLLFLVSLVWLTVIAGKRSGDEEIHLNLFDHLFTEIAAAGVVFVWVLGLDLAGTAVSISGRDYQMYLAAAIAVGVYTAALFLIGYLSLVRRIKAKALWKNSLLRWIFMWIKRLWRKAGNVLEIFSRNTGTKIKLTLLLGGFLVLQFLINLLVFEGSAAFFLLLFIVDCAALSWCILKADGQERILKGLKRICGGELQYKIPTDHLTGEQKMMAEYINHIGEGLDAAVDNSLKSERMKTELITNVSHDIKTPLTSIINYVDLLKRENFKDPKICGYLDVLDEKAQRLKILTEDVVEASKASSGAIALEMTDLNFIEMLHQVMGEFEEKFQEKNLTLMVHFSEEAVMIHADGRRLWRVLENVFNNVVKYAMEGTRVYTEATPAQGKVTFSLKNISAQPLNISADELTERFIRGDVSRNTEGSGLGLSIAKSLTELQGGEFKLYLDGDLFKVMITFPLVTKPEK